MEVSFDIIDNKEVAEIFTCRICSKLAMKPLECVTCGIVYCHNCISE